MLIHTYIPLVVDERSSVRYQDEWCFPPTLVLRYSTTEATDGIEALAMRPTSPLTLHSSLTLSFDRKGTGPHLVILRSIKGYLSEFFIRLSSLFSV